MCRRYTLRVHLPVDETYETLAPLLKRESYTKEYWHSFAPPHKFVYIFKALTEEQVQGYKEFFKEIYKDSKYKNSCNFETIEETE